MPSLFWRIFTTFWLAIILVAALSILLGHALQQDAWILKHHPILKVLPQRWVQTYEQQGPEQAQQLLARYKRKHRLDVQVVGKNGYPLVKGTSPPQAAAFEARERHRDRPLPWRRLTEDYISPDSGSNFLFIYRIPRPVLEAWQRSTLLWPASAVFITLVVLTSFSLLLTLSITRPLDRLRRAVHDLGQTSYQQASLQHLAQRRDELGVLAKDFNRMGARLQRLIASQRQLLRDVSHELRSPLTRLRITLALLERSESKQQAALWPRLQTECDRLESLIAEILTLARTDASPNPPAPMDLDQLLANLPSRPPPESHSLRQTVPSGIQLTGWADTLERALDNLLRNALRFNKGSEPVEINGQLQDGQLILEIRDHGSGAPEDDLPRLGTPFFRGSQPQGQGHGLGLAIARRGIERHGGHLTFTNHPQGGFVATIQLPLVADESSLPYLSGQA